MKKIVLAAILGTAVGVAVASADIVTIVDTTAAGATVDGTVNGGEYIGFGGGTNGGFGAVWGDGSQLHVDSDSAGNIYFGFVRGAGGFNNNAVIYIDSIGGGFSGTSTLEDSADGGRSAISGDGGGSESEITFGSGFLPDYAISWESGFAGLFQLNAGGNNSLVFVASLGNTQNPSTNMWEGAITAANLGIAPGGTFTYIVSYLNSGNAFRSDEFHGVNYVSSGNIGQNPVTLPDGQFNTFTTIPEPSTMILGAVGAIGLLVARRRRNA